MDEPREVTEARAVIAEWEARRGHDVGYDCLDGGWAGYQAVCWTCGWRGPERLRGDKPPESSEDKRAAKADMTRHRRETISGRWADNE